MCALSIHVLYIVISSYVLLWVCHTRVVVNGHNITCGDSYGYLCVYICMKYVYIYI